jgi:hypothetical protein
LPAAPPLQAWASPFTATSVTTVLPLRLKSVIDIGYRCPCRTLQPVPARAPAASALTFAAACPL